MVHPQFSAESQRGYCRRFSEALRALGRRFVLAKAETRQYAKVALDSGPCAPVILGGGHDLSASVRRLSRLRPRAREAHEAPQPANAEALGLYSLSARLYSPPPTSTTRCRSPKPGCASRPP